MTVIRELNNNGATIEHVRLSGKDSRAIEKAHEILARRCAEEGIEYGKDQRKWMYWCFMGALRIGGVDELMRYVQEAKICCGKKTIYTGYAGTEEVEDLR